ncbi:hypothetical protein SDC9_144194 [bioreactor metagenome]|uniref:Uncharacterized protein n=1 Tax=bioreactor metagenome TaxID=1076179 RepID=A0A645E893_9ZZZZ
MNVLEVRGQRRRNQPDANPDQNAKQRARELRQLQHKRKLG